MNTFSLKISSPDGDLFSGEAEMLILRGSEGELAVMAGHVPFVTAVVRNRCVVVTPDGGRKEGTIEDGILSVGKDAVTVLTSDVEWSA